MKENANICYPSHQTKELAKNTGLTFKQVDKWFVNQRYRKKHMMCGAELRSGD